MTTGTIRGPSSFGKRATVHTITVTKNGKSRHFNINPVTFTIGVCFIFTFMIGYFGATAYLVFRDDLVSASYAKHARMKHEYEDRIAALRSKLDHITSRQLLDQQAIESRVEELVKRQEIIGSQGGRPGNLMEQARERGLSETSPSGQVPVPTVNPSKDHASLDPVQTGTVLQPSSNPVGAMASTFTMRGTQETGSNASTGFDAFGSQFTNRLFGEVSQSINQIEGKQKERLDLMRVAANQRSQKLEQVLKNLGINLNADAGLDIGGPYEPIEGDADFDNYLEAFEESLLRYDYLSNKAKGLPLAYPVANPNISSRFGQRVDPFNGRRAMHSGVDFRAPTGTPVLATGDGKVTKAGRKGGYGKVVIIRHNNGLVTRYAHLSKITVKVGQDVTRGEMVGKVGSTGRSTGPHLHYEVRSSSKAHDPSRFMSAGRKIKDLI
ncbi:MAG: M23 family metallopeptidase [Pseudomonadota bacterium]